MNDQLLQVAKNYRHLNYSQTVTYAKELHQIITGKDLNLLLKQFIPNEDDDTFAQRKRITYHTTPSISNALIDAYMKVPQSTSISRVFSTTKETEKNEPELKVILNKFYGKKSFEDFCSTVFVMQNFLEPDGFIVIDWKETDTNKKRYQPYPFLVSAEMAVDYEYFNNILQYLIVRQEKDKLERLTWYGMNEVVIWQQVKEVGGVEGKKLAVTKQLTKEQTDPGYEWSVGPDNYILVNNKIYLVIEPKPHDLGEVTATKNGYKDSYAYQGTKESVIHPCLPYLHKLVKAISEMDLTDSLLTFPRTYAYDTPCEVCLGQLPEMQDCKKCGGKGGSIHKSASNIITLSLPHNPDPAQMIDLSKLIYFAFPPVDGMEYMVSRIDNHVKNCFAALYQADSYSRSDIQNAKVKTAEEVILTEQNKNTALYKFALHYSDFSEWGVNLISKIVDLPVTYTMVVGKDMKFRSKISYIEELKLKKDAGVSYMSIEVTQTEIIKNDFEDNPAEMNKWLIQERYRPFKDKTSTEIALLLAKLPLNDTDVVLWSRFGKIFYQIEREHIDFYELKPKEQDAIVQEYIDKFKKENTIEVPKLEVV